MIWLVVIAAVYAVTLLVAVVIGRMCALGDEHEREGW